MDPMGHVRSPRLMAEICPGDLNGFLVPFGRRRSQWSGHTYGKAVHGEAEDLHAVQVGPVCLEIPWEPKTRIFRGYDPYIEGLELSFFMVCLEIRWRSEFQFYLATVFFFEGLGFSDLLKILSNRWWIFGLFLVIIKQNFPTGWWQLKYLLCSSLLGEMIQLD